MTESDGGGTADLVAELRAQAEAAVVRAAETKTQVGREVVEVREQAEAVAAALKEGARQAAEIAEAESRRADEAAIAQAQARAAATIAEAEAQAASTRVGAAAVADEASAALARAEVRRESAAVQADALRLTARRESTLHRRQQLEEVNRVGNGQIDAVSDVIARVGSTLDALARSLSEMSPVAARLHSEIATADQAAATDDSPDGPGKSTGDTSTVTPFARPSAAERLRRVRHR